MSRKNFKGGADALFEKTTPPALPIDTISKGDPVFTGDPKTALESGLDDEPAERELLDNVKPEGVYFIGPRSVDAIIALGFSVQQDDPKSLTVFFWDEEIVLKLGEGITARGEKLEAI